MWPDPASLNELDVDCLAHRWQGRDKFAVIELGFDTATRFLAIWRAWLDDVDRCRRLNFISVLSPTSPEWDLAAVPPEWSELARALRGQWPPPVSGLHRLEFAEGHVVLLLGFGALQSIVAQLVCEADVFYIDGSSPSLDESARRPRVIRSLARIANRDAIVAVRNASSGLRAALEAAGFDGARQPSSPNQHVTAMARTPRRFTRRAPIVHRSPHSALVIGAGIAGCAAAHALARRGVHVTICDGNSQIAGGTSGNRIGALQPLIARDDNLAARFTRAAFLDAHRRIARLDPTQSWSNLAGLVRIARDDAEFEAMQVTARRLAFPLDILEVVDRETASSRAGMALANGGWWFARAGWVSPARYAQALLDDAGTNVCRKLGMSVDALSPTRGGWCALGVGGRTLDEAEIVVVAAADQSAALIRSVSTMAFPVERVRGQLTDLPSRGVVLPRVPVAGDGYVMPAVDGLGAVGSTYEFDDDAAPDLRATAHAENLLRYERLLNRSVDRAETPLAGRVAWRMISHDRMPMIGPVIDPLRACQSVEGCYVVTALASRGLAWAGLAGELLAAQIFGDPLPIERDLADAVAPGRYSLRTMRRAG